MYEDWLEKIALLRAFRLFVTRLTVCVFLARAVYFWVNGNTTKCVINSVIVVAVIIIDLIFIGRRIRALKKEIKRSGPAPVSKRKRKKEKSKAEA